MDARRRRKLDRAVLLTATALLGGAMLAACATPDTIDESGGSTSGGSGSGTSEGGGTGGGGSTGGGGNSGGGTGGGGTGGGGGGTAPKPAVYAWGLPPSDRSVSINDDFVYDQLRMSCDAGEQALDNLRPTTYGERTYGFSGPRFAVLMEAGIGVCRGDLASARYWFDLAIARYGSSGLAIPENPVESPGDYSCFLYRAILSVLDKRPGDQVVCPGGPIPDWRVDDSGRFVDDPLTPDVDESIPPTSDEQGSGGGTTGGGTEGETGGGGTGGTGTDGTDGTGGTQPGTDGGSGAETAPPTGGSG